MADIKAKGRLIERLTTPTHQELAGRVLYRNFFGDVSEKWIRRSHRFLKRINPATADDAPVDYRGQRRLTPVAALKQIGSLREEGNLEEAQIKVLDGLERYLIDKFTMKT